MQPWPFLSWHPLHRKLPTVRIIPICEFWEMLTDAQECVPVCVCVCVCVCVGWGGACSLPLKQQLYECLGTGEGSVRGQEDSAVVWFWAARVLQVANQPVQSGCFQPTDLAGPVLDVGLAGLGLSGVEGRRDGLSTQGDPIHHSVLALLAPLLHGVLGNRKQMKRGGGETRTPTCSRSTRKTGEKLLSKDPGLDADLATLVFGKTTLEVMMCTSSSASKLLGGSTGTQWCDKPPIAPIPWQHGGATGL